MIVRTVSKIMHEKFGLDVQAGHKGECPFCGKNTFAIKKDDTLGKCFHPSCGRYITRSGPAGGIVETINGILLPVYHDFHTALLALSDNPGQNAYHYLVSDRGIHPQVIADSMLGLVPNGYNTAKISAGLVSEYDEPEKPDGIATAREKLTSRIEWYNDWLCFFYTDHLHRIVAIRFRKPYSKKIRYFKPLPSAGLFGHGLFSPDTGLEIEGITNRLIVTEGEFNQLQLQSLCARHSEAIGRNLGYLPACAVGGVMNADYDTIRKVTRRPIICYDNDASSAGFALVEKASEHMHVEAFTTPDPDSDLYDFIRSFEDDHEAAWEAVKQLVEGRRLVPRKYDQVATEIYSTRQKKNGKDKRRDFEINAAVAATIKQDLRDRGRFYNDGHRAYFFNDADKKLIPIDPDNDDFVLLLSKFGLNTTESIFKYVLRELWVEAMENGVKTTVYRLAYYNPQKATVYLFNNDNQIYRISPESIDLVDNGSISPCSSL